MPIASSGRLRIHYFFRLAMFWLATFTLYRIVFIAGYGLQGHDAISGSSLGSFVHGFRLDLSTLAYLMLPAFALWSFYHFYQLPVLSWLHTWYHRIVLLGISILNVANTKMYHEWQSLVNYNVFNYLEHPGEVMAFIDGFELLLLVSICLALFCTTMIFFRIIVKNFARVEKSGLSKWSLMALMPFGFIIAARGGVQQIPVNESSAYFSDTPFYNHTAINPFWYFIHSYLETEHTTNPYVCMDTAFADERVRNLYLTDSLQSRSILKCDTPNVVIILLESWTADIIGALQGEQDVTPEFNALAKEGVLFSDIYAAGSRTEHGLISVLSGYPPPPMQSIITIPYKAEKLPNINSLLREACYHSSFYYGGEIGFANMKTYLTNAQFENIVDKSDFPPEQLNSKWGAHDEYVLEKQLADLSASPVPFFSVLLTLSTHEPFEVPAMTPFNGLTESDKFRKAAYYTDQCLGAYFKKAKKEGWYDNTLFILVADHGHRLPKKSNLNMPQSKRIPLMMFGEVIKETWRGKSIGITGNQNDIPATLLSQLNLDASAFTNSKDLLNPTSRSFAYYTTDYTLGWISPAQTFVYFYASGAITIPGQLPGKAIVNDSIFLDARAYLQTHYEQFLAF